MDITNETMVSEKDFENIKKEYDILLEQLSDPELLSNFERYEEINKRKSFLEKIIEKYNELKEIKNKIEENKSIISTEEDSELTTLAEGELTDLSQRHSKVEKEIDNLFKKGENEEIIPKSVIMEIRSGTGGEEASLFVADLFRMYSKYAKSQDFGLKVLDSRPTELGGFKEIIFELKGEDVFSKMRFEGGVHRVQRIPLTEKSGRIHTSTISVAVLAKPRSAQIKINPRDLKIDTYRASGPGGQYVNKTMSAIRITHLPTGLVVTSQTERSQPQNKENALSILAAKLLEKKQIAQEMKISGARKSQIGWAKRAEKIRTYNFPQDRITDHRIKKNWSNIEEILDGRLEKIIDDVNNTLKQ